MLVTAVAIVEVIAFRAEDGEVIASASERDIEEPPLLFDFFRTPGGHVCGNISVGRMNDGDGIPFESFCGMNGAEDQVVVIQQRIGGEILGLRGSIECHFGEEIRTGLVACGDGFKLFEIIQSSSSVVVG